MKRLHQRLVVAAPLALLAAWWLAGVLFPGASPPARNRSEEMDSRPPFSGTQAAVQPAPWAARFVTPPPSPSQLAELGSRPAIRDRFAGRPVLDVEEFVQPAGGPPLVRRVRLLREETFKYPVLRVEDDLLRTAAGDVLIRQTAMVGDHVLVKPRNPDVDAAALLKAAGEESAQVLRRMPASGVWLIHFPRPRAATVPAAMRRLARWSDSVRHAEPDYLVYSTATPNDTSFSTQWGMHNTGQEGGSADADIDATEAWDLFTGTAPPSPTSPLVAVLDSGLEINHPDIAPNIWTNPGEIPGNGTDDDNNGYVDDSHGWNFIHENSNIQDDFGHGTHCAGIIGAAGNNGQGVTGVCWRVSLVGLKFINVNGQGAVSDATEAISYATRLGVSITSNSYFWSSGQFTQIMESAIEEADEAGVLFIAAAGNEGSNLDHIPGYPAAYTCPNIISVAATTRTDALASYSNYSANFVHLAAPGTSILSTLPGGLYGRKDGTSMATPHVAGACALMRAYRPSLAHFQIRDLLLGSVHTLQSLSGKVKTGGRLDLYRALVACKDILVTPSSGLDATGPVGGPFSPDQKTLVLTNHGTTQAGWTATVNRNWVLLSSTSGTLSPNQQTTLDLVLDATRTASLLAGDHVATVTIRSISTGREQTRTVNLTATPPPLYSSSLDSDPGWPRNGPWQHGVPQGAGGVVVSDSTTGGYPDPSAAATGSKVFGINLGGNYDIANYEPSYLTMGPFNLAGLHSAKVSFRRWLNSDLEDWVAATLEVSTNGTTWTPVWSNGSEADHRDSQWTQAEHSLGSAADGQPGVYVRWGHQVMRTEARSYSGWNLDDVAVTAIPNKQIRITLPATLSEGGPAGSGRITIAPAQSSNLTVYLASSRPPGQELSVPFSVVIPLGQEEVTFSPITPVNDTALDGTQSVTITATPPGWPSASATVQVHDNESGNLTLTIPAQAAEGAGVLGTPGTLSLPSNAVANITVNLTSSEPSKVGVPATVTIPSGQSSVTFPLTILENNLIEGAQTVTITASVTNWPQRTASISLSDNEPLTLAVTLPASRLESAGLLQQAGTVTLAGTVVAPLTVFLSSNDLTELVAPAYVTIPAGAASAAFDMLLVDDGESDGPQTVHVTATAPGYTPGITSMVVNDSAVPALPVTPAPAHESTSVHPEQDLAWSVDPDSGGLPDSYDVYFSLGATPVDLLGNVPSAGCPLPRLPAGTSYSWQVVSRKGAAVRPGPVWRFTVAPMGPVSRLGWGEVPAQSATGSSFFARVTAYDEWDNIVTTCNEPASLTALLKQPQVTTGTGGHSWIYPVSPYYHDARTQCIYTPAEAGPAGRITAMALNVITAPSLPLQNFTVRLKHTSKASFNVGGGTWEPSGWTEVLRQNQTINSTGWVNFVFTTPFEYNGVQNLMVDISFDNSSAALNDSSACQSSITASYRTLALRSDSLAGDPLSWNHYSPQGVMYSYLPNLRFTRDDLPLAMTPQNTGALVNGTWSGSITVQGSGTDVVLKAALSSDAGIHGLSTPVDVISPDEFTFNAEPIFTGGTTNTVSWLPLGEGFDYEVQCASQANFSDAVSTGFITVTSHEFTGLTDGQLYHYRGRARTSGIVGGWCAPQRSTQDFTPPAFSTSLPSGGMAFSDHVMLQGWGQDASGLSLLSVNGVIASTASAFASWSQPVIALQEGLNTITLTATDNAVPPNTRTETWTVTRVSNYGEDADLNGVPLLLEHAFNAAGPQPAPLVTAAAGHDEQTQLRHLMLTYRRLMHNPGGFQYIIETSPNLVTWTPAGSNAEELSSIPNDDDQTETVTVRIHPAMTGTRSIFVRVRVAVP